jgi:type VI secretion system protein ImpG
VLPVGYSDDEAMLPVTLRGLAGTRLMQEYFAFPQRFLFIDLAGLAPAFAQVSGNVCEIVLLFTRYVGPLEGAVEADNFLLHCVPAVNPLRAARRTHATERRGDPPSTSCPSAPRRPTSKCSTWSR